MLIFSDSEPAFFNYISRLKAEKHYLEEEAIPDWRHKAARVVFRTMMRTIQNVLWHGPLAH
jgi:hypothetical protein